MKPAGDVKHKEGAPILEIENVLLKHEARVTLDDLCFSLSQGERVALVGPNGAGKSTLFKLIAGVITPTRGAVRIGGHDPAGHICIAYLPQRSEVDWTFPVTVLDVVLMGRVGQLGLLKRMRGKDRKLARACLATVDMADLANRQIGELSGGQQQRMFIAQALAQEASLMLMDEPFTGLDLKSQGDIFRILDDLKERGVTVMVALHDLDMAAEHFDRVMLLNKKLMGLGKPADVFTTENLKAAYGHHLQIVQTDKGLIVLSDTCCDGGHDHG